MNRTNFRHEARNALERARSHLTTGQNEYLKYAALELRMAMEALTYDRAQAFAEELPPSKYDTWQPRKLLQILLEIDPLADEDNTISVGIEHEYGVPPDTMQSVGSEKVLNLTMLKHYDALGSYLHMPTIKQISQGKGPDLQKLKKRCETIECFINEILNSTVFNVVIGNSIKAACAQCKNVIKRRVPFDRKSVKIRCFDCSASYTVDLREDGQALWTPDKRPVNCANPGCRIQNFLWSDEIALGAVWNCGACSSKHQFALGIRLYEPGSTP